jgi:hypothetical protein
MLFFSVNSLKYIKKTQPLIFNFESNKKVKQNLFLKKKSNIKMSLENIEEKYSFNNKKKLEAEQIFFQGPPSRTELLIPAISILTIIGIIPFLATLFRQLWVRYTITNRRIAVDSGFQGKNRVEIVYRDIKKISSITRLGGSIADVVIVLNDNARLELRSLPDWEKNIEYIKEKCIRDNENP